MLVGAITALVTVSAAHAGAAAGAHGGTPLYRSKDGGRRWEQLSTGRNEIAVSDIRVDPTTPSTVYAVSRHYGVIAIVRSRDAGDSWETLVEGTFANVFDLAIDPRTPSTL